MTLAATQPAPAPPNTRRRYDIDVLRVAAVLLLIYFHTACMFMEGHFHVHNPQRCRAATIFVVLLGQWHMPLFFLLAGASTWLALDFRSGGRYVVERVRRLFLPAAFGILLVIPPQVYVERISPWSPARMSPIDFHGTYWEFYPHFFEGTYPTGNFSWHHLWFIVYLFVYSVVTLPIVLWLKRHPRGQRFAERFGDLLAPGHRVFLLAIPGIVLNLALWPLFPPTHALMDDWCLHSQYLFLFLLGCLLMADERLMTAVVRNFTAALGLAAALTLVLFWPEGLRRISGTTGRLIWTFASGLNGTCWLIFILGLGRTRLNRALPGLAYASRIAYPFYILHQTVLVVLAYYVLRWPTGAAAKYLIISTAGLLVTVGLCDLIRRTPVTRFMFGMPLRGGRRPSKDPSFPPNAGRSLLELPLGS